jgi:hypothetical protein
VGTISSADRVQLEAAYPHIRAEVDEAERAIRRPRGEQRLQDSGGTLTGFLLRSRAVSGWPNLHVRGYSVDSLPDNELTNLAESAPQRMKVLRMERLAPAVLLVIFDGVPAVVHVEEPRQGIQFGVRLDPEAPTGNSYRAKVRVRSNATGQPVPPLTSFVAGNSVNVPFRSGAPGVLHVGELRRRLQAHPGVGQNPLAPNQFALQMLRFPFRQVFGDPGNTQGQQFYNLDKFVVKTSLPDWRKTLGNVINGGTP